MPLWEVRWLKSASRRLPTFTIDVSSDRKGEYFEILRGRNAPDFEILQSLPKERHLLMMTSSGRRFLCGHDERHWFSAEVVKPVSSVRDARLALMPSGTEEKVRGISPSEMETRDNSVFKRQGEWFFFPVELQFDESIIHRDEPIQRRAGSKPHICEELVREGGETVYIIYGRVYTEGEYKGLRIEHRRRARVMRRNALVYVRGYVRHPDHSRIKLDGWHLVQLNNEKVSRNLAFLD